MKMLGQYAGLFTCKSFLVLTHVASFEKALPEEK